MDDANGRTKSRRERLEDAFKFQIRYYRQGAKSNRLGLSKFQVLLIVLAAATTIIVGIELGEDDDWDLKLKNAALVLSALSTAVTSYVSFKDFRGKWILWQEIYLRLIQARANYQFEIAEATVTDPVVEKAWAQLQEILKEAHDRRIEGLNEAEGGG